MKTLNKTFAAVSALALAVVAAQPAFAAKAAPAPAPASASTGEGGTIVPGLAMANFDAIIVNSNAFKLAEQQRQTTYKAQFDQARSRSDAINAQLKPLADKFNADRAGGKVPEAQLQAQANNLQQIQENGRAELQRILAPASASQTYVSEQIEDKLNDAVKAAMKKRSISILLSPDAILAVNGGAYNLNQDILNEVNAALPSAQLVPPAGWMPRQQREQQEQQQAQSSAPTSTTSGR